MRSRAMSWKICRYPAKWEMISTKLADAMGTSRPPKAVLPATAATEMKWLGKRPARLMPRGSYAVLERVCRVVEIVTRNLHGDAVELNVRTQRDVLVEGRLVENRIGAGRNVGPVADVAGVDLGLAAPGLGIHVEAGTRVSATAVIVGGGGVGVVVDQIVDLIDVELVAAAAQRLVHHIRHHDGTGRSEVVEIDDRAAEAAGVEVEIDLHVDLHVDLV